MADDNEIRIGEDDRPIKEPQEGIEELRAKLKVEEERRLAAETRAHKLAGDLQEKTGEVAQTNVQIVESAISVQTQIKEQAREAYRQARAAGDVDAELEATEAMQDATTKLNQLELGLKAMKEAPPPSRETPATRTGDPVEDLARSMEIEGHQRSADWIRKHPEFARDQKKYAAMIGAHNVAVNGRGLTPNTDEYFADVEKTLGIEAATRHAPHADDPVPNGHDALSSAGRAVQERGADVAPPAAPPSRGGGSNAIRLTAAQKEAAQISGISEEEYAANLKRGKN